MLPGIEFTNVATDSKRDDCTEIANITMPTNPCETGNLKKVLTVKVNAKVMITTNIDVNDGLRNGAMGTVTNVVIDERTGQMICILVVFDSKHVGQEAIHTSAHKNKNQNVVPIYKTQATFPIHTQKKTSCQATRSQFPLTLAWAVTIHKCQGLTLPEIVIDMTPAKGKVKPGEAYVAFSRVRTLEKLHIINYT